MDINNLMQNKEQYKISIINQIRTNNMLLLNDELILNYVNYCLKDELRGKKYVEVLLNQMVIKLSKNHKMYDKYLKDFLEISYREYKTRVQKEVNAVNNLTYVSKYAISNIDFIDYNNDIESTITAIYSNILIKNKLKGLKNARWFIKYIIDNKSKKTNMRVTTIGYDFDHTIDKNKTYCLYYPEYKKMKSKNFLKNYNMYIYINLGYFKYLKRTKGFNFAIINLLRSCYRNYIKCMNMTNELTVTYDIKSLRKIKENLIIKNDHKFYEENYNYFDDSIVSDKKINEYILEDLQSFIFNDTDVEYVLVSKSSEYLNSSKYKEILKHTDDLLIKAPSLLNDYPLLRLEYNYDGKRKSLRELIQIKNEKIKLFTNMKDNLYNSFINEKDKMIKDDLEFKYNRLYIGINEVEKAHNVMIVNKIREYNLLEFKDVIETLTDEENKNIIKAINEEQNYLLEKIVENRKNIRNNKVYLANDEYLNKEYHKVSSYERKFNATKKI